MHDFTSNNFFFICLHQSDRILILAIAAAANVRSTFSSRPSPATADYNDLICVVNVHSVCPNLIFSYSNRSFCRTSRLQRLRRRRRRRQRLPLRRPSYFHSFALFFRRFFSSVSLFVCPIVRLYPHSFELIFGF